MFIYQQSSIFCRLPRLYKQLVIIFLALYSFAFTYTSYADNPSNRPQIILSGVMGNQAIITINGTTPRTLTPGQSYQGVKLISVQGNQATVAITDSQGNTTQTTLRIGSAPISLDYAAPSPDTSSRPTTTHTTVCRPQSTTIRVNQGRMFMAKGYINNHVVDFLVDTGATFVSLSETDAKRLGIRNYRNPNNLIIMRTANGESSAYRFTLPSVKLGSLVVNNVQAVIGGDQGDIILLGNSFLNHFDLKMTPDTLTLTERCSSP